MKELYNSTLAVVAWSLILYHLVLIKVYGIVQIQEGNQLIFWAEITAVSLVLILAVVCFIKDFRDTRRGQG